MTSLLSLFHIKIRGGPEPPHPGPYSPPTPDGGYSKSTDVYYWHKLCKTSASRLFRTFLDILPESYTEGFLSSGLTPSL